MPFRLRTACRRAGPDRLLCQPRVWNATTFAEGFTGQGLVTLPRSVRKYLHLMGARDVRTQGQCTTLGINLRGQPNL